MRDPPPPKMTEGPSQIWEGTPPQNGPRDPPKWPRDRPQNGWRAARDPPPPPKRAPGSEGPPPLPPQRGGLRALPLPPRRPLAGRAAGHAGSCSCVNGGGARHAGSWSSVPLKRPRGMLGREVGCGKPAAKAAGSCSSGPVAAARGAGSCSLSGGRGRQRMPGVGSSSKPEAARAEGSSNPLWERPQGIVGIVVQTTLEARDAGSCSLALRAFWEGLSPAPTRALRPKRGFGLAAWHAGSCSSLKRGQ